jgi:hypothetical protein
VRRPGDADRKDHLGVPRPGGNARPLRHRGPEFDQGPARWSLRRTTRSARRSAAQHNGRGRRDSVGWPGRQSAPDPLTVRATASGAAVRLTVSTCSSTWRLARRGDARHLAPALYVLAPSPRRDGHGQWAGTGAGGPAPATADRGDDRSRGIRVATITAEPEPVAAGGAATVRWSERPQRHQPSGGGHRRQGTLHAGVDGPARNRSGHGGHATFGGGFYSAPVPPRQGHPTRDRLP